MSTSSVVSAVKSPPRHPTRPRSSGLLAILSGWYRRREQRRSLLRLSDHVLHDIGMKRIDVHLVAIRPFRPR